ncbi:DNA-3-methyladenine glycosylase family protein [Streptomyces sp. NPDC050560]|uniref:DNA-3-methyladenine glycosylase family protein n=1 Tax=Streptomyces sp. NPDC050560 TaxID=3365630 RepID=UPI003798DC5A
MSESGGDPYRILAQCDPVLKGLVGACGRPDPYAWHDGGRTGTSLFAALLLHIVGQRISAAAAFTVYDRVADAAGGGVPTPRAVLSLGADGLGAQGLTRGKADCAMAVARGQVDGTLVLDDLAKADDAEVLRALTSVKGLGLWSAQAFLMRQLRRPDVLPAQDAGIRRAIQTRWELPAPPAPGQVRQRATAWAPYRSYAAALLWKSLYPPGEPSDPKERALARQGHEDRGRTTRRS